MVGATQEETRERVCSGTQSLHTALSTVHLEHFLEKNTTQRYATRSTGRPLKCTTTLTVSNYVFWAVFHKSANML